VTSLVGTVVDDVVLTVERGKVLEMARATRAEDPVHTDPDAARAAGFGDLAATATHVVVAGHLRDQLAYVRALGLVRERVVVGEVAWEFERPLVVGDVVRGTRTVVADETKQGRGGGTMRIVTLETAYVDPAGTIVVRQTESIIERGAPA
jgi:acyl dehydratase